MYYLTSGFIDQIMIAKHLVIAFSLNSLLISGS